jgi:hypothetical protein
MNGFQRYILSDFRLSAVLQRHGKVILALLFLLFRSPVFAADFGVTASLDYYKLESSVDTQKNTTDRLTQNYYLRYNSEITPILNYGFYLRSGISDMTRTDIAGLSTKSSSKDVEPMLDLIFRNPIYNFNAGYRHKESWLESSKADSVRATEGYFYSRLDIIPVDLPRFFLQYDNTKRTPGDNLDTTYSLQSLYNFTYKDLAAGYNVRYQRLDSTRGPTESITDIFSGQYSISYHRSFWNNRLKVNSAYQGNYNQNIFEQFVSGSGTVTVKNPVMSFQGLYNTLNGTFLQPNADTLDTVEPLLIDSDLITGINRLNIGTTPYINIGINVSPTASVNGLYIYVNRDVTDDTGLVNPGNWRVYKNSINAQWQSAGTVTIQSVLPVEVDNNIFRYELVFSVPQDADWYKVINLESVNVLSSPEMDVLVTEVVAYNTVEIVAGNSLKQELITLNQGLTVSASLKVLSSLDLTLTYTVTRTDSQPDSVPNSMSGFFQNIFSKTLSEKDVEALYNVTRNYGASASWLAHRLLTTRLSVQRSMSFDNLDTVDYSNNAYSLTLSYLPLPTLDMNLSFNRNDSFSFGLKTITNETAELSTGAKLYKDVNLSIDSGLARVKSFADNTKQTNLYLTGNLQARLTPKISGNMIYRLSSSKSNKENFISHGSFAGEEAPVTQEGLSDNGDSVTQEGSLYVNYRPGRLLSISGIVKILDSEELQTLQNMLSLDWRPLPALSLSLRYQQTSTRPGDKSFNSLYAALKWRIFRFMDAQLFYSSSRTEQLSSSEKSIVGVKLNCSFW